MHPFKTSFSSCMFTHVFTPSMCPRGPGRPMEDEEKESPNKRMFLCGIRNFHRVFSFLIFFGNLHFHILDMLTPLTKNVHPHPSLGRPLLWAHLLCGCVL